MRYFYGIINQMEDNFHGALYEVPQEFVIMAKILGYFPEPSQLVTLAKQNEIRAIRTLQNAYIRCVAQELYDSFCGAVNSEVHTVVNGKAYMPFEVYGNVWYTTENGGL